MSTRFLYEKLDVLKEVGALTDLPDLIKKGLSSSILLREYQEDAFRYFITYFETETLRKKQKVHTLFHMATGSGKTVIMAGLILYLYTKGYRKFMFFVNQTNILEKTKESFTNPLFTKYLFADEIDYLGDKINIKKVNNFSDNILNNDIEICFTTTQKLHMDLLNPKEESLTYDDFESNKIVFISDESHHVNTLTKGLSKEETEAVNSWEYSVQNALSKNSESVMLEFTATANLQDSNVLKKYTDKIIFNYPLIEFRKSGYTKDFQNFATDSDLWERALIALVMSEYRRYVFADIKLNIKPVIMLKSQKIAESEMFYNIFFERIKFLTPQELFALDTSNIEILSKALNYFKSKDNSLELLVHTLKESFTERNSIIVNGSQDNNKEKQLLVNSLEDQSNPIRLIFAVDMLNEGWDVLNLFDIVRLYDTRQSSGKVGKVGSYTIKEAQLIGRGARYCPFNIGDDETIYKRKYDEDLDNEKRILETMLFHSRNDSRYISELKAALVLTGMGDPNPIELEYVLKENFKNTELYKSGYVFSNSLLPIGRFGVTSIEEYMKNKVYRYTQPSASGKITNLIIDTDKEDTATDTQNFKFKDLDYNIVSGASERFNELKFCVIKEKYPAVKSLREFLTSEDYLGNCSVDIKSYTGSITGRDLYRACTSALEHVAAHVLSIKQEFEGSKEFQPRKIKDVVKNKKVYISGVNGDGGKGDSQISCLNPDYQLDLTNEDWYIFNDNFGTSEEKLFIKYFKTNIAPKLKAKNLEYFIVRNERVPELAIYSFDNGSRFEPDFLLFVSADSSYKLNHQVYIEPKGDHLLVRDEWKEEFLVEIEKEHVIHNLMVNPNNYKIIGLPFYNQASKISDFSKAIDVWINNI